MFLSIFRVFIIDLFLRSCQCSAEGESNGKNFAEEMYSRENNLTLSADYNYVHSKEKVTDILSQILGGDYDSKVRPSGLNVDGPTIVYVNVFVKSIENIDDVQMEYSVQLTFRQEWSDPRLKYSRFQTNIKYLYLSGPNRVWKPDLYFLNQKKGVLHELMVPNLFTRIYPNGTVLQSYRIMLLLSCVFNLKKFPLDVQHCPISASSYGWTSDDLAVEWRKYNSVKFGKDLNMARFKVTNMHTVDCDYMTSTGPYSCIRLNLNFEREIGFYLIQIYIPCGMLVIVSWVSFWLEPTAIEARVSLGVTTILTIVTQTYGINQSAPPASYVKALDVWTAFCQAMVFAALLQFALVNYISNRQFLKARKQVYETDEDEPIRRNHEELEEKLRKNFYKRAKRIDLASRVIFPFIFILFNITYWASYLGS